MFRTLRLFFAAVCLSLFFAGEGKLYAQKLSEGRFNNLMVFIIFSDDDTGFSKPYNRYLEEYNLSATSLKNYFLEASYGVSDIHTAFLPSSTYMHFKDPNPKMYYEPYNEHTNIMGYQSEEEAAKRRSALAFNALSWLKKVNEIPPNLNLDKDGDGYIDNITFIFKGGESKTSSILKKGRYDYVLQTPVEVNSANFSAFTLVPEDETSPAKYAEQLLKLFGAHELSRPEGSPVEPTAVWDIMGMNMGQMPSLYTRSLAGWADLGDIPEITSEGLYTLAPASLDKNAAYKIKLPKSREYLLLEYYWDRANTNFASKLFASSLVVFRIDELAKGSSYNDDEIYSFRPFGTNSDNGISFASSPLDISEYSDFSPAKIWAKNRSLPELKIYDIKQIDGGGKVSFKVAFPTLSLNKTHISFGSEAYLADTVNIQTRHLNLEADCDSAWVYVNRRDYINPQIIVKTQSANRSGKIRSATIRIRAWSSDEEMEEVYVNVLQGNDFAYNMPKTLKVIPPPKWDMHGLYCDGTWLYGLSNGERAGRENMAYRYSTGGNFQKELEVSGLNGRKFTDGAFDGRYFVLPCRDSLFFVSPQTFEVSHKLRVEAQVQALSCAYGGYFWIVDYDGKLHYVSPAGASEKTISLPENIPLTINGIASDYTDANSKTLWLYTDGGSSLSFIHALDTGNGKVTQSVPIDISGIDLDNKYKPEARGMEFFKDFKGIGFIAGIAPAIGEEDSGYFWSYFCDALNPLFGLSSNSLDLTAEKGSMAGVEVIGFDGFAFNYENPAQNIFDVEIKGHSISFTTKSATAKNRCENFGVVSQNTGAVENLRVCQLKEPRQDLNFEKQRLIIAPNILSGTTGYGSRIYVKDGSIEELEVYNLKGQLLMKKTCSGEESDEVDFSQLMQGIYIVRVSGSAGSFSAKISRF